jgi:hypothetical protein
MRSPYAAHLIILERKKTVFLSHQKCPERDTHSTEHRLSKQPVNISGPSFLLLYVSVQYKNFGCKVWLIIMKINYKKYNDFLLSVSIYIVKLK